MYRENSVLYVGILIRIPFELLSRVTFLSIKSDIINIIDDLFFVYECRQKYNIFWNVIYYD